MRIIGFTDKEVQFIKDNRLSMPSRLLAEKLHCSKYKVQRFIASKKWQPSKKVIEQFRIRGMTGRTTCTPWEDVLIKRYYLKMPIKRLAEKIGRSFTLVNNRLRQLGLVIPPELIEERKQIGRLKKGNTPPNKGKKWEEFMSKEGRRNSRKTCFKKGNLPHNTKTDGEIVIRHNHKKRGGKPYKWIRLSKAKWEMLHVHIWKNKYGPVPEGHIIVFKDGNTMNVKLRNLACITRQKHAENTRNSDGYIATRIAVKSGGKGLIDKELQEIVLTQKDLIEAKRLQLKLSRKIKSMQNEK
jgi:hypothetical protein